jgi:hypothetical protein
MRRQLTVNQIEINRQKHKAKSDFGQVVGGFAQDINKAFAESTGKKAASDVEKFIAVDSQTTSPSDWETAFKAKKQEESKALSSTNPIAKLHFQVSVSEGEKQLKKLSEKKELENKVYETVNNIQKTVSNKSNLYAHILEDDGYSEENYQSYMNTTFSGYEGMAPKDVVGMKKNALGGLINSTLRLGNLSSADSLVRKGVSDGLISSSEERTYDNAIEARAKKSEKQQESFNDNLSKAIYENALAGIITPQVEHYADVHGFEGDHNIHNIISSTVDELKGLRLESPNTDIERFISGRMGYLTKDPSNDRVIRAFGLLPQSYIDLSSSISFDKDKNVIVNEGLLEHTIDTQLPAVLEESSFTSLLLGRQVSGLNKDDLETLRKAFDNTDRNKAIQLVRKITDMPNSETLIDEWASPLEKELIKSGFSSTMVDNFIKNDLYYKVTTADTVRKDTKVIYEVATDQGFPVDEGFIEGVKGFKITGKGKDDKVKKVKEDKTISKTQVQAYIDENHHKINTAFGSQWIPGKTPEGRTISQKLGRLITEPVTVAKEFGKKEEKPVESLRAVGREPHVPVEDAEIIYDNPIDQLMSQYTLKDGYAVLRSETEKDRKTQLKEQKKSLKGLEEQFLPFEEADKAKKARQLEEKLDPELTPFPSPTKEEGIQREELRKGIAGTKEEIELLSQDKSLQEIFAQGNIRTQDIGNGQSVYMYTNKNGHDVTLSFPNGKAFVVNTSGGQDNISISSSEYEAVEPESMTKQGRVPIKDYGWWERALAKGEYSFRTSLFLRDLLETPELQRKMMNIAVSEGYFAEGGFVEGAGNLLNDFAGATGQFINPINLLLVGGAAKAAGGIAGKTLSKGYMQGIVEEMLKWSSYEGSKDIIDHLTDVNKERPLTAEELANKMIGTSIMVAPFGVIKGHGRAKGAKIDIERAEKVKENQERIRKWREAQKPTEEIQ